MANNSGSLANAAPMGDVKEADISVPPTRPSPLSDAVSPRSNTSISSDRTAPRPYVSRIAILNTSLPAYHRAYMEAKAAEKAGKKMENTTTPEDVDDPRTHPLTDAEKAESARRLNPHSRNQKAIDDASKRPDGMTPVPAKKAKPTKWQFGIRSRNQPLEAIGCIYRALQKLGAEWTVDEDFEERQGEGDQDDKKYAKDSPNYLDFNSIPSVESNYFGNSDGDGDGGSGRSGGGNGLSTSQNANSMQFSMENLADGIGNIQFKRKDPKTTYKLPADPWVIHVRWNKDGMFTLRISLR